MSARPALKIASPTIEDDQHNRAGASLPCGRADQIRAGAAWPWRPQLSARLQKRHDRPVEDRMMLAAPAALLSHYLINPPTVFCTRVLVYSRR